MEFILMDMKNLIYEQSTCSGTKQPPNVATDPTYLQNNDCVKCASDGDRWYCTPKTTTTTTTVAGTTTTTTTVAGTTTTTTTGSGFSMPNVNIDLGVDVIKNAWGKIVSWFGSKVDGTGEWMKKTFTKSDYEKAMEDCFKVPYVDETSAKTALENGDIVDYYQLKDKDGKVVFLGKAWDCNNEGGTPPCFKKLAGGRYDESKDAYIEEYFEELNDAGVYEYYCNGTVAFKPYYESDETGDYIESSRPKVWYKWDTKTGIINKA